MFPKLKKKKKKKNSAGIHSLWEKNYYLAN